jgi:serine/threonine-protein kinase HipA
VIRRLKVGFMFEPGTNIPVGEMLHSQNGEVYFQFDANILTSTLSPSPFKLKKLAEPQNPVSKDLGLFDGLFGVFADSLPDGWGLLMMSRAMRRAGANFAEATALDRLSYIGRNGMGALVYEPAQHNGDHNLGPIDLSALAKEAERVMEGKTEDVLAELTALGGSPGGARPKVLVGFSSDHSENRAQRIVAGLTELPPNFSHWIVKFRAKDESPDASILEYIYAQTAQHVGIKMTECRLIEDRLGQPWFATKRFDRGPHNTRIHVHSAAGLLHADFRLPSLDYSDLLKLTKALTRRDDDLLAMFRLAAFNIMFHNRDDHAKNFAYTMDPTGQWRLAPAYDLCFTAGPGGEHSTAILGEGRSPTLSHLHRLAAEHHISSAVAKAVVEEVESGRSFMKDLLKQYGIRLPMKEF